MIHLIDTVTPTADVPYAKDNPAAAFAGYVGGTYADLDAIRRDYPNHRFVSIAVNDTETAEFCDCERFDFSPDQVLVWLKRMHAAGVWRPGVYAAASTLSDLLPYIARAMPRLMYRVWGAEWNGVANVPNGWDAHQYATEPDGRDVDLSVCLDSFFPVTHRVERRKPHVEPKPKFEVVSALVTYNTRGEWAIDKHDS